MHSKTIAPDASGSRQEKTMNTTIALDEIRAIGAWTPIGMDTLEVACSAIDRAAEEKSLDAMHAACLRTLTDAGVKFLDENHARMKAWDAVILLKGLQLFHGNDKLAKDFRCGYLFHKDSCGNSFDVYSGCNVAAWTAGREANKDYPVHLAARAFADQRLIAKFGEKSKTKKAFAYWLKQYFASFNIRRNAMQLRK